MGFTPDRESLAWAAGFFDGEGHVRREKGTDFRIAMPQTDRRVLDRFRVAVNNLGGVFGPDRAKGNRNPQWHYRASGHPTVQAICAMLWPWLSPVKREQFRAAFMAAPLRAHFRYRFKDCIHGVHLPLKRCGECRRAYNRHYYQGHKAEHLEQSRRQRRKPEFRERERIRNRLAMRQRRLKKLATALLVAG